MSKCIRDSVHGNIIVPDEFAKNIIDTPAFQRLRRVEQTAIRSIFPSARHDRFIHSLGVYHIGKKIVDNILESDRHALKINEEEWNRITSSYLIACLLHDISHAPFSHTFEYYYGPKSKLADELKSLLGGTFADDLQNIDAPNFHEYASAIVTIKEFKEIIEKQLYGDVEFVCRMIIGCFYEKNKEENLIQNCFIPLLHGDIVDADRLDYVCRDVWASGYATASVDIDRLVAGIHIKYKQEEPVVCVDSKVLNEIVNMLEVKQFQNRYVINHHSVQYEQQLMIYAAEFTAQRLIEGKSGVDALRDIININNTIGTIKVGGYTINRLSDEDLLALMKQDKENKFYHEFSTRNYTRFAIWKSPDEFYYYFPSVPRNADLKRPQFEELVKTALSKFCNPYDIIICKVVYKEAVKLSSLYVIVNEEIVRYTDIYPEYDIKECGNRDINFYYVFVPKPEDKSKDLDEYRRILVEALTPIIKELYPVDDKEFTLLDNLLNIVETTYHDNKIDGYDSIHNKREEINSKMNISQFMKDSGMIDFINSLKVG